MYVTLTSSSSPSSSVFSLSSVLYMAADPGYDDKKLYEYSKKILGYIWFVLSRKVQKILPKRGLILYAFISRHWVSISTIREEYL